MADRSVRVLFQSVHRIASFYPLLHTMGTPDTAAVGKTAGSESRDSDVIKVQNEDELRLAQMGEF